MDKIKNTGDKSLNQKIRGADIIIKTLAQLGVDTVFGYPGGAVLNIYDALYQYNETTSKKIRHILTSHEQHAAHAADGYARATGKLGVVIATSGPGASNLVTALATAKMDSSPILAITGNVDRALLGLDSFQEIDVIGVTMPITKHNFLVTDIKNLENIIKEGFKIACSGRKAPVLIDVPKDVTAQLYEYSGVNYDLDNSHPALDNAHDFNISKANEIISIIKSSKKPYIYAGGGVISSTCEKEVYKLATSLNAPVSCSLMGQGAFDQMHENYIGMLGMHGTTAAAYAFSECDLFIALGTRFSDRVIGDRELFSRKQIIHIDIDSSEHSKNVFTEYEIIGNLQHILSYINSNISSEFNNELLYETQKLLKEDKNIPQVPRSSFTATPKEIFETLYNLTLGDLIITTEVGQNQIWTAQYFNFRNSRSFITSGGLGTMGFGLGAAIGAKIGRDDKTVVCVSGDGSFGMNMNELVTLRRYNIPIIVLLLNNSVLGMVRQWQRLFYNKRFSQTTLDNPIDYSALSAAFGINSAVINKKEDILSVLSTALEKTKSGEPFFIEAKIDRDLNVLPMVPAGKDITKPILEMPDI